MSMIIKARGMKKFYILLIALLVISCSKTEKEEEETGWFLQKRIGNLLYSVFFTDVNTGYVCGYVNLGSTILKTTNGGNDWSSQNSTYPHNFNSIYFPGKDTGYIVGLACDEIGGGIILKTTTGGEGSK